MSRSGKGTKKWIEELLAKAIKTQDIVSAHFRNGVIKEKLGVNHRLLKVVKLLKEAEELMGK